MSLLLCCYVCSEYVSSSKKKKKKKLLEDKPEITLDVFNKIESKWIKRFGFALQLHSIVKGYWLPKAVIADWIMLFPPNKGFSLLTMYHFIQDINNQAEECTACSQISTQNSRISCHWYMNNQSSQCLSLSNSLRKYRCWDLSYFNTTCRSIIGRNTSSSERSAAHPRRNSWFFSANKDRKL